MKSESQNILDNVISSQALLKIPHHVVTAAKKGKIACNKLLNKGCMERKKKKEEK